MSLTPTFGKGGLSRSRASTSRGLSKSLLSLIFKGWKLLLLLEWRPMPFSTRFFNPENLTHFVVKEIMHILKCTIFSHLNVITNFSLRISDAKRLKKLATLAFNVCWVTSWLLSGLIRKSIEERKAASFAQCGNYGNLVFFLEKKFVKAPFLIEQ